MTKKRSAKNTFIASIVSMVLCLTMLIGTSLAWFTDTANNDSNIIQMGELGIELRMAMNTAVEGEEAGYKYVDVSDENNTEQKKIFSEALNGKWEPGKTEIVFLQVANTGDLALKYNIILDIVDDIADDAGYAIKDVMEYAIFPEMDKAAFDAIVSEIKNKKAEDDEIATTNGLINTKTYWQYLSEYANDKQVGYTGKIEEGSLTAAENGTLDNLDSEKEDSDYFVLAVHMSETAENVYQKHQVKIDVEVKATQTTSEGDYFDNIYDESAEFYTEPSESEGLTNGSDETGLSEE